MAHRQSHRGGGLGGGGVLVCALTALAAFAGAAGAATWNVTDVYNFDYAMGHLSPGDEVVLAAGMYDLTLKHGYYVTTPNITIRGATGNRDDVTIWGGGMNNPNAILEGIQLVAADQTISDLTLEGFYHHAIHFQNGADRALVSNVRTLNIGEHHIKGVRFNDGGIIENSLLEQTEVRQDGLGGRPDGYLGGIDLLGARNWIIRDNVVKGIKGINAPDGSGRGDAGIFLWQDIVGAVIERNVIIGTNKGIALGNPYNPNLIVHAEDSIVRNNFITRGLDIGLELAYTKNVSAYNNTIYGANGSYFRAVHIYDKPGRLTENLTLAYNIIRGRIYRNADGTWTETGNIEGGTAQAGWFVDPAAGDLHLTALATGAIDQAGVLADVLRDFDLALRGPLPDVGADEFNPPIPGDATLDGVVSIVDLGALASNWQSTEATWYGGDFSGDGLVNITDLGILASHWQHGAAGLSASVPEPGTLALLALGGSCLLIWRRRPTP
ncbi:hypothetical protein LCGC14_1619550 [marine sediment metagenome]|uniref:Ice-binding protein C-terminal domain-containing protein n=1 Tax=marine sediment metagenome TaxID=412755 RepID=A0A0F9I667_9ZZZZ